MLGSLPLSWGKLLIAVTSWLHVVPNVYLLDRNFGHLVEVVSLEKDIIVDGLLNLLDR